MRDPLHRVPPSPDPDPQIRAHADLVYATCRRVLGNDADAADATQECFLRWLATRDQQRGNLAAWLHAMAHGTAVDWLRRIEARARAEHGAGELIMATNGTSDPSAWSEVLPHLDDALLELPEGERTLLVEHHLLGQEQAALAQRHRIDQGTVSRRLQRARESLKQILERRGVVGAAVVLGLGAWSPAQAACPAELAGSLMTTLGAAGTGAVGTTAATPAVGWTVGSGGTAFGVGALGLLALGLAGVLLAGSGSADPAPVSPSAATESVDARLRQQLDALTARWLPAGAITVSAPVGHVRRPSVEAWLARHQPADLAAQERFLAVAGSVSDGELAEGYQESPSFQAARARSGPLIGAIFAQMTPAELEQAAASNTPGRNWFPPRLRAAWDEAERRVVPLNAPKNNDEWITSPDGADWLARTLPQARAVIAAFGDLGPADLTWSATAQSYADGMWDPPLLDQNRYLPFFNQIAPALRRVTLSLRVLRLQAQRTGAWDEALDAADLVRDRTRHAYDQFWPMMALQCLAARDGIYLAAVVDGRGPQDRLMAWISEPSTRPALAQEQLIGWLQMDVIPLVEDALAGVPVGTSATAAASIPGITEPGWWTPAMAEAMTTWLASVERQIDRLPDRLLEPDADTVSLPPVVRSLNKILHQSLSIFVARESGMMNRAAAQVVLRTRQDGHLPINLEALDDGAPWSRLQHGDALCSGFQLVADPPHGFFIVPAAAVQPASAGGVTTAVAVATPTLLTDQWEQRDLVSGQQATGGMADVIRLDAGPNPVLAPTDPTAPSGTN